MTRALGSCKYGAECGLTLDCECDCCITVHECECEPDDDVDEGMWNYPDDTPAPDEKEPDRG